ncbi:hypothetical protein [Shewanella sp. HN-41]|uniref:hypothetical protein n=1 Tax=Shewanella sp. HN-41 TaxID=327275 RepID=UPI000569D770|nr:hypothetical protein [Shewanella sp. HN-41]
MNQDTKKRFVSNLKSTSKFLGLVYLPMAIFIVVNALLEDDYSNALVPLYMLFLIPSIVVSVVVYSQLETSQRNKTIRAIGFSISGTFTLMLSYVVGNYLDANEIDLNSIARITPISLVIHALLYIQLPWSKDNDV